jgi:hypothetical protein
MSVILEFRLDRSRRPRRSAEPDGRLGVILFFTGVRIERHAETMVEPGAQPNNGHRREA